MRTIPEPVVFEWDKGNIDKNAKKHKVENREAEEVFENDPLIISRDVRHSYREERFLALGKTDAERRLTLSFTLRINKVRIISVRDMSKKERREYEKEI